MPTNASAAQKAQTFLIAALIVAFFINLAVGYFFLFLGDWICAFVFGMVAGGLRLSKLLNAVLTAVCMSGSTLGMWLGVPAVAGSPTPFLHSLFAVVMVLAISLAIYAFSYRFATKAASHA